MISIEDFNTKDGFKKCTKCKRLLAFNKFGKSSKEKDGLKHRCKECRNEENKLRVINLKKQNTNELLKEKSEKEVKQCRICKHWKFLADFRVCKARVDGYDTRCKSCYAKQSNEYYHKNKEKIKLRNQSRYAINRDKEKERSYKYYLQNKEKEYWRTLKKRTLKNANELLNNISTISNKRLKRQSKVLDKYLHLFTNDSYKYSIIRKAITEVFLECEKRDLGIIYNYKDLSKSELDK